MGSYDRSIHICVVAFLLFLFLALATTLSTAQSGPCTSPTSICVTTWQQDTYRTGQNLQEGTLVSGALGTFGELCSQQLDGQVYGQPLVATNVTIPNKGTFNYVVYVVTQNDTLYAINGDGSNTSGRCAILGSVPFLTTGATNRQFQVDCTWIGAVGGTSCTHTIGPYVGILGTPVITTNGTSGTIYVVTETQDVNPLPNHAGGPPQGAGPA